MNIPRSVHVRRHSQDGSAVLVLLALLVIMAMLVTANSSTLLHLHREMKLLDQRQAERLNASQTNATATAISSGQPGSK